MFTTSALFYLFITGYMIQSLYYVWKSSLPAIPCSTGSQSNNDHNIESCIKPLFVPTRADTFDSKENNNDLTLYLLELWIYDEVPHETTELDSTPSSSDTDDQISTRYQWTRLSSCPLITFNYTDTNYSFSFFGEERPTQKCSLKFPSFSRIRVSNSPERTTTTTSLSNQNNNIQNLRINNILKAKFILRLQQNPHIIISQTTFDMTRLVQRGHLSIPHFKYSKQPIILRIIDDNQYYSTQAPYRNDGTRLSLMYTSKPMYVDFKEDNHHSKNKNEKRYIYHRPVMYVDDVTLRHSSQIELAPEDETIQRPPVNITLQVKIISPLRHIVWHSQLQIIMSILDTFLNGPELDEIRYFLTDEYLYRFILTQIITTVHIWLEYQAFRQEVGFYVGKTDMGGVSLSTLASRFFCELIIFLYLLDTGNTSWIILLSIFSGVLLEFWKLKKFLHLTVKVTNRYPYCAIRWNYQSNRTDLEKLTEDYDAIARIHLTLILYPLLVGISLYARQQYVYKSVWSWFISNLANAVYTFGFISLCPQLYVNYRLKSIAHLPYKVFIYKIFTTFIDDVFSFLIQAPLKHKLMTLRDDFVFILFLGQAYLYRVDKKRMNEFGYVYEEKNDLIGS